MKSFWPIALCLVASAAWAEEPLPPPQAEDQDRQIIDILTEEDLKQDPPDITLKQLAPKETIPLDQAVSMPSDI